MYVIADINGKQYKLEEGRYLHVDRLVQAEDEVVEIGNVLMVVDGDQTLVGAPFVDGAKIKAKVLSHGRDKKVLVYKMHRKKGYRRKNGHRQQFTRLQVEVIEFPGKKASAKPAKADKPAEEKAAKKPAAKKEKTEDKAEKAPAKKPAAKKAEKKEAAPKKETAKKTEAKKTEKKEPAAKKPAAKKTEKKEPAAKKPAAKKTEAKKD